MVRRYTFVTSLCCSIAVLLGFKTPNAEPALLTYHLGTEGGAASYAKVQVYAPKSLAAPPVQTDDTLIMRDAFGQAFEKEFFTDFAVIAGSETYKVCGERGALLKCVAA